MPSKQTIYDHLLDFSWFIALCLVPLFQNVYSSRIFEPDKNALLRLIAVIGLVGWIGKAWQAPVTFSRLRTGLKKWLGEPVLIPVFLLLGFALISAIFSIAPQLSWLGSYQRGQGIASLLSYLIIFFSMLANLRQWEDVKRILNWIVIVSLPVSLYAIVQRFGWDPIPWGGDVTQRVASTLGNPIFLAGYLILVSPLTLIRIILEGRSIANDGRPSVFVLLQLTALMFLFVLQVAAILFTNSRGPWLGWFAGLLIFGMLFLAVNGKRWLFAGMVVAGITGVAFLFVLNMPDGPLSGLRQYPVFNRLGQALDTESRTGRVRTLIWRGAAEMMFDPQTLSYPDGSTDRWSNVRQVIGYGPETLIVAFNKYYPPELTEVERRNSSPDRAHNETWDALITTGWPGMISQMLIFVMAFFSGFRWLGLIPDFKAAIFFGVSVVAGALAGSFILVSLMGTGFLGLGLPFGFLGGVFVFVVWQGLFKSTRPYMTLPFQEQVVVIALLALITSHFVEVHFGIAITATRLYFWVALAMLILITKQWLNKPQSAEPVIEGTGKSDKPKRISKQPVSWQWKLPVWITGNAGQTALGFSVIMLCLVYDFMVNLTRSGNMIDILSQFTFASQAPSGIPIVFWGTLLIGSVLTIGNSDGKGMSRHFVFVGVVGLLISTIYGAIHSATLAGISATDVQSEEAVLQQISRYTGILTGFVTIVGVIIGFGLVSLPVDKLVATSTRWIAVIVLVIGGSFGFILTIPSIQADMVFKLAEPFEQNSQWPTAIFIYRQAVERAPEQDQYYLFLGRAYLEYARNVPGTEDRRAVLSEARQTLERARQINPLNPDHTANLARLYSWWATVEPERVDELASASSEQYAIATQLSPNNAVLYGEWALVRLGLLGETDEALASLSQALALDPNYDRLYGVQGDAFLQLARTASAEDQKLDYARRAAASYELAILNYPQNSIDQNLLFNYHIALATANIEAENYRGAIVAYETARQYAPVDIVWQIEKLLADYYLELNDQEAAVQALLRALNTAPQDAIADLQNQLDTLMEIP